MKEEIIMDNFQLVSDITFLTYSAQSDMFKVDRTQARLLNKKYGVDIFWHSLKRDGAEFDSYLAYFGYPHDKSYWIDTKLREAQLKIFQELDPKYGTDYSEAENIGAAFSKEHEERVEKFWDKAKLIDLLTSNAPPYLLEHHLFLTLSLEDETEFLEKSKELGLLKNVL